MIATIIEAPFEIQKYINPPSWIWKDCKVKPLEVQHEKEKEKEKA